MDFHSFSKGDYMTNAYVAWKPTIDGLGPGSYRFAMYSIDGTDTAPYSRGLGLNPAVDALKRRMIEAALREAGSKSQAAQKLGIPRQSLQKMMLRLVLGPLLYLQ